MNFRSFFQFNTKTTTDKELGQFSRGLTLIEVIVAVGIIVITAGFIFAERSSFSKSINLSNITQEVAVVLRQAQTYGISNRSSDFSAGIEEFSHGMYFDTSTPQQLILFRDQNNDGSFQSNELLEEYRLPPSMNVSALCEEVDGAGSCTSGAVNDLIIMFRRPNPDAFFYDKNGNELIRSQMIVVITSDDSYRTITVGTTGFISVN